MDAEVVAVVNLKGGSGKSTSTAFLAHAFAAAGRRALVVDADPQGSLMDWSDLAEWSIPTVGLPVKNLHTRLPGIVPPGTDVVVIDTPPLEDHAGIVRAALRVADKVVVTMAPTMMEYGRLARVWEEIEEMEPLRSAPSVSTVLLNRTVANARSTETFRQLITDDGHHVLTTQIPRLELFAQAFSSPVTDFGAYADVAAELDTLGVAA